MRFIRARGWLRRILGGYLGCAPREVSLVRLPGGKPCLAHGELRFNLSHTDVRALLAVSAEYTLGVDVEEICPVPEAMLLARRWFSKEEMRWINESGDKERAFLRCWVCREAVLKAWGTGLAISLDALVLQPPPYPAVPDSEGRQLLIAELAPGPECVAAIALYEP
ncbi:MAG: 4'-phosphopantetheinyl transferase superfamily protein [Desulfocurvibacter africanus]